MPSHAPHEFFRVQHRNAFTKFNREDGFKSHESYQYGRLPPVQWLNKRAVEDHISRAKPANGIFTPFISMFDNFSHACDFAHQLKSRGYNGVYIARIEPGQLTGIAIELRFEDRTVFLPAWLAETGFVLTSTHAVRSVLGVDARKCHQAEWFAIEYIPAECITLVEDSSIATPLAVVSRCKCKDCEARLNPPREAGSWKI